LVFGRWSAIGGGMTLGYNRLVEEEEVFVFYA